MKERYWLRVSGLAWQEVTEDKFIEAERGAGFRPKSGTGVATGGFSTGGIRGRVTYGKVTARTYPDEPDFVALAQTSSIAAQPVS